MRSLIPVTNFLGLIGSIVGLISFFAFPGIFPTIILISACICVLHVVLNYCFGELNGFQTDILAVVIGVIVALIFKFNIRNAICVAICLKTVIINILPWVFFLRG